MKYIDAQLNYKQKQNKLIWSTNDLLIEKYIFYVYMTMTYILILSLEMAKLAIVSKD